MWISEQKKELNQVFSYYQECQNSWDFMSLDFGSIDFFKQNITCLFNRIE